MKVLFCGDVSPTADNSELFSKVQTKALFSDTVSLFQQADFSVVNLECAITESETPIEKIGPPLKAPLQTADVLAELNVTCCGISNNHIFDFGKTGVADTLRELSRVGIQTTGYGANDAESRKNLILEQDGVRVCVIAVCEHEYSYALEDREGCRYFDEFETPLEIRAAKESADRVVVLYHGGKEHCAYPSPRLRRACHAMAKSGADLILCQHSHCIGCYEEFQGCHILYGQGNFHFVKEKYRDSPSWFECLATVYHPEENRVEWIPVAADAACVGIRLADAKEKERILKEFQERSQRLADGSWLEGWKEFCESKRDVYTRAVARAGVEENGERAMQMFAHYLDCEAHSDVWKELFQTYNKTNEKN